MYSAAKDKWITLFATLDTGTQENWICESALEALALERAQTTQVGFMDFSGEVVTSTGIVWIPWYATGNARKVRKDKFRVAKSVAPFDVVLGSYLSFSESFFSLDKPTWIPGRKDNNEGKCNSLIESF